jgi:hypothetical protein
MNLRKAWAAIDPFDRVVCIALSSLGFFGCMTIAVFVAHNWQGRALAIGAALTLAVWPWQQIPADSHRMRLASSVCGDNSGPRSMFCVLEPGHFGDHKHFSSNGGAIGWPNAKDPWQRRP